MASKRQLKKQIRYICGDVAAECALARHLLEGVDKDKLTEAIRHIAELQQATLSRVSVKFDKTPREFENRGAYLKSRHAFEAKAFEALRGDFNSRLQEIVKDMHAALPAKK